MDSASKQRWTNNKGFSLVEILTVILILSIILIFAVPSFISLSPSRRAKIAEISAFLEKARARAIANQRDVYVSFVDDRFTDPEFSFRAMAIFMSSSFLEEGEPVDTRKLEQLEATFLLPLDLVFADNSDLVAQGVDDSTMTILDSTTVRDFPFRVGSDIVQSDSLPYLLFNKSGRLEVPFFSGSELFVAITEGYVEDGKKIISGDVDRDRSELIRISYQSGAISTVVR